MERKECLLAPSLLAADFGRMAEEVEKAERAGADWLHLDVMDGVFVPNLTFGAKMVSDLRRVTALPLDVHLMTANPGFYVPLFADAGADWITFHLEAEVHAHRLIQRIRELGKKAGISIVPSTPAEHLAELLPELDLILIMSVNPGFGGQKMIPGCLQKVEKLVKLREEGRYHFLTAVDGGVNRDTAPMVRNSGADVLISGSAFFGADDPGSAADALKGR